MQRGESSLIAETAGGTPHLTRPCQLLPVLVMAEARPVDDAPAYLFSKPAPALTAGYFPLKGRALPLVPSAILLNTLPFQLLYGLENLFFNDRRVCCLRKILLPFPVVSNMSCGERVRREAFLP